MGGALHEPRSSAAIMLLLFARPSWLGPPTARRTAPTGPVPRTLSIPALPGHSSRRSSSMARCAARPGEPALAAVSGESGRVPLLDRGRVRDRPASTGCSPSGRRTSRKQHVPYVAPGALCLHSIALLILCAFERTSPAAGRHVIATTFLGSAIAAAVLPWRKPHIYNASPL